MRQPELTAEDVPRRMPVGEPHPPTDSTISGCTLVAAGFDLTDLPEWAYELEALLFYQGVTDGGQRAGILRQLREDPRERMLWALRFGKRWWEHIGVGPGEP